jgi:uncharacterized cupin superfamily protein
MNVVHFPTLPADERHSPGKKFHSFCQNVSLALGGKRDTGPWGGGHPFDVQLRRIPAGAAVCPHHAHLAQWELFLVRRGEGTVRVGDATQPVRAGDVLLHPPGEAHQLLNTGAGELEVLIVADNPPLDAFYYPDSNKWGLRPPNRFFTLEEADYFAGEDPAPSVLPPAASSLAAAIRPQASPFRRLHLDDLPWEPWLSPKKKFGSRSKELSIALGARRNTPVGLGGHPFDLELARLAPGQCACPYHRHLLQWEMFMIFSGTAHVRVNGETATLRAGDVVLHAPGTAHQIRNAGADELEFLLIADNPPGDYYEYPDSAKWGLREPRTNFRMQTVDYWEGEE